MYICQTVLHLEYKGKLFGPKLNNLDKFLE